MKRKTKKKTPKTRATSHPAGGYGDPKPRKKRLDEAGDWTDKYPNMGLRRRQNR